MELLHHGLIEGKAKGTLHGDDVAVGDVRRLVDRVGEEFPVVKDPGTCRNVLLNGKKLYLLDKKDVFRGMGLWALRLQFTTENPGEIDKILMDYQGRAAFDAGSYTRGLYSRGVE